MNEETQTLSLLPVNATPFERAVEQTIARASDLKVDIDTLWNPDTCPEALLPWLAWALSVDTWDSNWPEATKRAFLTNSFKVHQNKGTLASLKRVLNSLGIVVEIEEWFESGGAPHTFKLTAFVNDNQMSTSGGGLENTVLNQALFDNLIRLVDDVKPARSHYTFQVGVAFGSELALGSAAFAISFKRETMAPRAQTEIATNLQLTAGIQLIATIRADLEPQTS